MPLHLKLQYVDDPVMNKAREGEWHKSDSSEIKLTISKSHGQNFFYGLA